jgi:hypothetical protein
LSVDTFDYRDSGLERDVIANAPDVRRMVLSKPQTQGFTALDRYLSLEGAYRSGKTVGALLKVGDWCWRYPGIPWLLSRWTDEATFSQLRPAFLELYGDRVYKWLADEHCYLIYSKDSESKGVYSRVYFTGLRPSEGTSPFSKIHGKKFACALIDQPEEMPEQYFDHMRTRLSAPGFPQQLILCPNPQVKTHWLSVNFPEDNSRRSEGYYLVKFRMRDNVVGLGEEYVAARERELRHKPAEFRRALLGDRGLPMVGKPIFGELFQRDWHVVEPGTLFNPALPLHESFDHGTLHPACTWTQYPSGRMHVLGGLLGDDMPIGRFVEEVIKLRNEWFPDLHPSLLSWTADPAGSAKNPHGTRRAVDVLQDYDISPIIKPDANQPPKQDVAIAELSGYLERAWFDGTPTFALDPRFVIVNKHGERQTDTVLVDGFELGFVWDDDHAYSNTQYPHVRPWKRDKWFEHPFVTMLYSIMAFAPPDAAEQAGVLRNAAALRRARKILMAQDVPDGEIAEIIHGSDRARVLAARVEHDRLKLERRGRQIDTVEIEHERMMRERMRDQPGYERGRRGYFGSRRSDRSGYGGISRGGI